MRWQWLVAQVVGYTISDMHPCWLSLVAGGAPKDLVRRRKDLGWRWAQSLNRNCSRLCRPHGNALR